MRRDTLSARKIIYTHTKCGGTIQIRKMRCTRCGKQWNPISFLFTTQIRPQAVYVDVDVERRLHKSRWYPPNWPMWAKMVLLIGVAVAVGFGLRLLFLHVL